jgi:DNA-binding transcriptional ArsR family regulator
MRYIKAMIETLSALAEPNRFRIVELLRSGARPVHEIETRLKLTQPQASKHLRVLREAGLVDVEPRAQARFYALKPEPMRALHTWIERYRSLWDDRFDALDQLVKELKAEEKTRGRKRKV